MWNAGCVLRQPDDCRISLAAGNMKQRLQRGGSDVTELDAVDRRILAELQADGRVTNVELARRARISSPPCLRRVRRLEEKGVIRGYHADIDPVALGAPITLFALIGLDSQKEAVLQGFEEMVASWPETIECHMIRGGGDFLVRLAASDPAQENILTSRLTEAPHVVRVQTLQTIRTSLERPGPYPLDMETTFS